MDLRISENELSAMHVWNASMIMLVRPGEAFGVSLFEAPVLADNVKDPSPYHFLVIEVEDPKSPVTQARIRANLRACLLC